MNQLRALLHTLGPMGIVAIGLLLACLSFHLSAVAPAESELAAQQRAAQRLKSRTPYQPVALDSKSEDLRRFHSLFPQITLIPGEIEKLWAVAAQSQIELRQGEYRLESNGPGLARYRVTLPMDATASVDGLRFERKKIGDTQLDAQITLTFYFNPSTQAPTPPKAP